MVEMTVKYEGDLRCSAVHGPSGGDIFTDAPKDNEGQGRSFSPTDLFSTSLGACMLTVMGIAARRHDIDMTGATCVVRKHMASAPVRRVAKLEVIITVDKPLSEDDQKRLRNAALSCPVHKSLHPDIEVEHTFNLGS